MRRSWQMLLLSVLMVLLQGCGFGLVKSQLTFLEEGMTEQQVLDALGHPDDLFGPITTYYGESVALWYYSERTEGFFRGAQPPLGRFWHGADVAR